MAIRARRRTGQSQRYLHALGGFQKIELGLGLQILAAPRPTGPRCGTAATEQPAEQVTDIGAAILAGGAEQVVEVEAAGAVIAAAEAATTATVEAAAESAAGEHPAGLVVLLAFVLVEQDVLGLPDGLVAFLCRRVVGVTVRMILREQLAGDPLDLVIGGIGGDAERLIEVFFNPFALNHPASPPRRVHRVYWTDSGGSSASTASTTPTSACRST